MLNLILFSEIIVSNYQYHLLKEFFILMLYNGCDYTTFRDSRGHQKDSLFSKHISANNRLGCRTKNENPN